MISYNTCLTELKTFFGKNPKTNLYDLHRFLEDWIGIKSLKSRCYILQQAYNQKMFIMEGNKWKRKQYLKE